MKNLEDLKFRENPVLKEQNTETGVQLTVARISKLQYLNGIEIIPSERRGAEYDYLKLFSAGWKNSENNDQLRREFVANHPRFPALVESKLID